MEQKLKEKILNGMFLGGESVPKACLNNLTQQDFDELLLDIIFNLRKYPHLKKASGDEGTVYFLDDNFVVKKYNSSIYFRFNPVDRFGVSAFDKYFSEMQRFYESGLSVNKYYSHITINKGENLGLYVLQERVKGKTLFEEKCLSQLFYKVEDICTRQEFKTALNEQKGELYNLVVEYFINNFYETNKALNNVSDDELTRFILSDYNILNDGQFALLDTQASNVMFDNERLTIIDPALLSEKIVKTADSQRFNKIMVVRDMIMLFKNNIFAYTFLHCNKLIGKGKLAYDNFVKENMLVTAKAIKRYVAATNDLIKPIFSSDRVYDFYACKGIVDPIVSENNAQEILNMLQKD